MTARMKHILTIVCLMLALSVCAQGQQSENRRPNVQMRQGWSRNTPQQQQVPNRSGQFSPTEYWNQQKAFFTEKAGLTEDEAAAFFPLYNELQQKKRDLNREMRRMTRQENQTEEQAQKSLDAIADFNIRIAELEKENVELEEWKEQTIKARGRDYMDWSRMKDDWNEMNDQLTKAKEIILRLYNAGRDVLMCRAEEKAYDNLSNAINDKSIEQFLSEAGK